MNCQPQQIYVHRLKNGLTVIGEEMPWLESVAFSLAVPAGCQYDPQDRSGLANFVCEMVQRGCGQLNSREFIERLESLGIDYGSSASVYHTHFNGAMPAERLGPALQVYRDVLREPWLPEDQLEDGRQVCFQEIRAIDDDLAQRVMLQLRLRQYGQPRGRWSQGTREHVSQISASDIREFYERYYQPDGVILSVAGKLDWPVLVETAEALFGDWDGRAATPIEDCDQVSGSLHIPFESQQSHIGLACPSIPYNHPDYYLARTAVGILSDGMSSRLFAELRERQGLCYTVFASLHSVLNQACVVSYVGTGAERAQQSLDALIEQLVHLREGAAREELDRLKVQIRSSLIMQQESSRLRAGSMAGDWLHLDRVRTRSEIDSHIAGLTIETVNRYLAEHPFTNFNLVTLGPEPLELDHAVSPASAG